MAVRLDTEAGLDALAADLDPDTGAFLALDTGSASPYVTQLGGGGGGSSTVRPVAGTAAAQAGLGPRRAGLHYPAGLVFVRDFEKSVELWKSFSVALTLKIPLAHPGLFPNAPAVLSGVHPFDGPVLLTSVADEWGEGGYSQIVECRSSAAMDTAMAQASEYEVLALDTGTATPYTTQLGGGAEAVLDEAGGEGG